MKHHLVTTNYVVYWEKITFFQRKYLDQSLEEYEHVLQINSADEVQTTSIEVEKCEYQ